MRRTVITSESDPAIVGLSKNIPNALTLIAKSVTPRGAVYRLHNSVATKNGAVNGTYIILKLNKEDGEQISIGSRVVIATKGPADEFPKFHRALTYGIWHDLDTVKQRNDDYKFTVISQCDLNTGAGLEIPEQHELMIYLESPDEVDWEKGSFFQFDVQELN